MQQNQYINEYHHYQVTTGWHGPIEVYIKWRSAQAIKQMQALDITA